MQFSALTGETIAILLGIAAVALALLAFWEARAPEPIVPLELWRNPIVSTTNVGSLAIGMVMMGVIVFVPPYVQGVMGRSPVVAGFTLVSQSLGWTVIGAFAGRLLVRVTYRTMAICGGVLLDLRQHYAGDARCRARPGLAFLSGGLIGFGIGFCNTTFLVAAQNAVPYQQRGAATSGNLFMRQFGASFGAALLGGVINWALTQRIPEGRDAIDQLMDPVQRAAMAPDTLTRLSAAIASSLTTVYVVVLILAVISCTLCFPLLLASAPSGSLAQTVPSTASIFFFSVSALNGLTM